MLKSDSRKYAVITALLMLSALFFPLTSILGAGIGEGPGPSGPPDPPGDAHRVNMSETIPNGFVYRYNTSDPQVFQFRNMTMQFYANRQFEVNITGEPGLRLHYLDMQLQLQHSLMLNVRTRLGPPDDIQGPHDGVYHYIELEPNGTANIQARIRLYIDQKEVEGLANRSVNRNLLRWCYWNGSDWAPVHSWIDEEGFLVCDTDHFSLWTIREMKEPLTMPTPNIPGVPNHVKTYNYSHMTPQEFRWTIHENEGRLFAFRNMTLMINCTRNMEMNLTAGDNVVQRLFRLQLNPVEALRLNMNLQINPPGNAEEPEKGIGFYIEIESNSSEPVNAKLGLHVDAAELEEKLGREVNSTQLRWAFWNGTMWQHVETTLGEDDILECETDHFSTWTILEVELDTGDTAGNGDETDGSGQGIPGFPYESLTMGLLIAILLVYMFKNNK
jgi:hypothetical protein